MRSLNKPVPQKFNLIFISSSQLRNQAIRRATCQLIAQYGKKISMCRGMTTPLIICSFGL
jgi:hypothetical protein